MVSAVSRIRLISSAVSSLIPSKSLDRSCIRSFPFRFIVQNDQIFTVDFCDMDMDNF